MANIVDSIVGVLASSKHVIVSSDLTGNTAVSSTHPLITIKNNNSDSHGALLRLQKDTSDEANNDVTGVIQFTGNSDSGNRIHFGSIDCQQTSVSNSSETGKLRFNVATSSSGTNTEIMTIQGGTHITPIVDSQTVINGSLKARLYNGNDPFELTKACNIDLGDHFGYNCHILDKKHQTKISNTSTPFKISDSPTSSSLTQGTGITTTYKSWIENYNNEIKTNILIDIDGLRNSGSLNDIIGLDGTSNPCHLGQITNSVCGQVYKIKITCLETPAGGGGTINLYEASVASGKENDDITSLTEKQLFLCDQTWSVGDESVIFTTITPNYHIYLVNGAIGSDAEYTAGQFLIEIFGNKVISNGSGITSIYKSWNEHFQDNNEVKTNIYIDLTDLESEATLNDIIGNDGAANSHIGQVNYNTTGIIYKAQITCLETPTGGEVDIDVYQAPIGTGTEGALITSLTGYSVLLDTSADWTSGTKKEFTNIPINDYFMYLTVGTSSSPTAGTYTAGKFLIEIYGIVNSIVPCYDIDFGSGFKMSTGSTSGNYIELCSQDPAYTCASGRSWWIETQFKLNDFDATEFFFGIAEPKCGSEDLIYVSSTTFVKAAGKDRVGLSKLTHNATTITAGVTQNTSGSESIALTNNITYNKDNLIITLGIYWDGISSIYFYGSTRDTGTPITNNSLLLQYQGSTINVIPNDSSNYLRLFINNGEAVSKTATINYIRGKILLPNSTTIYTY